MMQRTQIMLEPDDHRRATQKATAAGISLAEYIRRLIRADLAEPPVADISAIFGIGDSGGAGGSAVTGRLRDGIGEAVEAEFLKDMGRE